MDQDRVPLELARMWRIPLDSKLGRPAKLDVGTVVDAAVALADREGLAAATLPRVAESLGVTKMSLYRHVGSKDELLDLMRDSATGPVPDALAGTGPWRERMRMWATAHLDVLAAHPWLAHVQPSGPPNGPNGIDWFDAGLRALRLTGLDWGAKVGALMIVGGYVASAAQLAQSLAAGREGTGLDQAAAEREYGRAMARLVDPERYPDAAALFSGGLLEDTGDETGENDFRFGLELLLDGIAVAVAEAGDG
ncbi:transcriptional regulator, TetR family [Glycomyces sambucus]|uniref:Transcriptional regulator, TetR family n=1 Tax=Glycomyces sambucus TaxID=380244 RepID=A0A1G9HY38_9ACTN|nr:TetR/AcrR family transcriptional regulator [Glycomyces sambucus]SDL17890.1 transcriptional regulator, TetR family [Glycomyces sambucus]